MYSVGELVTTGMLETCVWSSKDVHLSWVFWAFLESLGLDKLPAMMEIQRRDVHLSKCHGGVMEEEVPRKNTELIFHRV
jgi:hypothetical protein